MKFDDLGHYDYLIVGAGLFGSICAYELTKKGKSVFIVDQRQHIGGNMYTEEREGIVVHKYGAHIFRTSDKSVWDYMNQFVEFKPFINSPIAKYQDELYNLPFNMNTFYQLWGVKTPDEAMKRIKKDLIPNDNPQNLEEYVLSVAGKTIYEKLIKGYTEKQWGTDCKNLSPDIIKRVPLTFKFDNNYSAGRTYQGIPHGGYTQIFDKLLKFIPCMLYVDGDELIKLVPNIADHVIHTGCIDKFYNYQFGKLPYRSLRFEELVMPTSNYQGVAVVNYTDKKYNYTRIIEHKHFDWVDTDKTVITFEYPVNSDVQEPYYPIVNDDTMLLYDKYAEHNRVTNPHIDFVGRLGGYKYVDMDTTVSNALAYVQKLI